MISFIYLLIKVRWRVVELEDKSRLHFLKFTALMAEIVE